jgi:diacylglycerol kinase family enzyme
MSPPPAIAVILNASAGTASGHPQIVSELGDLFHASGCDAGIIELRAGEDVKKAARDASARAAIVVAAGGDGTVSSVANGIFGSESALGVLPLGTLNHFAKDLHIPLDPRQAVAVLAAGHLERVDVGQVNDRVFVNNSSIGVYPDIVQERELLRRQGRRKWSAMSIATLRVLRRYHGVTVRMDMDGRQKNWRTPFVLIGNNEYAIDGIRLGSRARVDRGKLFIYVAPRARTRDLPVLFAKALAGRARESGAFEIVAATELTIDTRTARWISVAVDGEVTRMTTPLSYRTCPGELQVVVPADSESLPRVG